MWFALLLVSICGLVQGLSRVDPLVSTKVGLIRGLRTDEGHAKFLGVPYAVVDENSPFGPSKPHPGFDDIFEAYESNVCPQASSQGTVGTLDCLTMNIYVPNAANSRNRLPVMVWIHGGAFVMGSAENEGGPNFLLRNDVIFVAINYRLGVYGFMCLDIPEVPGNQGLKDQVLALRWINENIEAFGGDATQITAFGESAGGMSVNLHLLSPYEKLFNRAIIQSGPAISPWTFVESDNTIPLKLAEALDFNTEDVLEAVTFMSSIDVHTLVKLARDLQITGAGPTEQPLTKVCIEKEFEGVEHIITKHPMNIQSPKLSTTPLIIGNNNDEIPYQAGDAYNFELVSSEFDFGDNLKDVLDDVIHFYVGDENSVVETNEFETDFTFNHPTQRMAERFLELGAKTVYRYIFSYNGGRNSMTVAMNMTSNGATHADELGYLFDMENLQGQTSAEDQLVIDRMTTLWTNFAKYGNPTPETSELLPVKWEPISKTHQTSLIINSDLTIEGRPFHDRMAFWDLFYKLYSNQHKSFKGSDE